MRANISSGKMEEEVQALKYEELSGSVAVFECFVPANARMPAPHSHDGVEETICGLDGTSTWTIRRSDGGNRPR